MDCENFDLDDVTTKYCYKLFTCKTNFEDRN